MTGGFLDFSEARLLARKFLPRALFDYIDRGTEAETALADLRRCFDNQRVIPRVLRPVTSPDLTARIMGTTRATPFIIAPTALAGLVRYNGEVVMARAAQIAGLPFCAATQASTSIEEIAKGAPNADLWFQLYVWRDRAETWRLLDRVTSLGIDTLLLTVDTPASPKKLHNLRNGFSIPMRPSLRLACDLALHPRWTLGVMGRYGIGPGLPSYANYPGEIATQVTAAITDPRFALDTVLDIDFLQELRQRWPGKLILKGIASPDDAKIAFDAGCDAVVLSSHGGRNLDSAVAPLQVLPAMREAVGPAATILADSGIQRGSDAAKLLAAGADGVLLGRAPLWGLAAGAQRGVEDMLGIFADELRAFMAFAGASDLNSLRQLAWQRGT